MKHHRIRVFLGGYVNSLNAQNINCRALSEHLDKDRFEVWTMLTWYGSAKDFQRVSGVHYLYDTPCGLFEKMHLPYWLFAWMTYAIGILRCDVAYLPKGEYDRFCLFVARLCGCKVFTTLEGVFDKELLGRVRDPKQSINKYRLYEPNLYSITNYLACVEKKDHDLLCRDKILYLGTDTEWFLSKSHIITTMANVVMIGNDLNRKKAEDFIQMASLLTQITFHVVGGNDINGKSVKDYITIVGVSNVIYHGLLDHTQLSSLLEQMDLMFFPSHSEGFPKVMLETACAGVPTLCYGDYGADEWITTGKDGFVVNTFDEAKTVIQQLIDHPEQLQELSKNAIELGKRFDWKVLVKDWEEEIERMARG